MKRLKMITLQPRPDDALFVIEELALFTCLKYGKRVEFEFKGRKFSVSYSDLAKCCIEE